MYDNGDFEQMLEMLRKPEGRMVKIRLKYKRGKLKDFTLIKESLAEAYNDERFLQMELTGSGINDRSVADR